MKKIYFITDLLSPGEFFDRLSIIIRKAKFDPENYSKRVDEYKSILDKNGLNGELLILLCKLQMVNTDIWNLESDIRLGKEGVLGITEVGARALKIREINAERIALENKLNELFGIEKKEIKIEHASE